MKVQVLTGVLLLAACTRKATVDAVDAGAATAAKVAPFEPLQRVTDDADGGDSDALFRVVPLPVTGPAVPAGAVVKVDGATASVDPASLRGVVVLEFTEETYLAQVAALLTQLDDAKAEVWVKHPDAAVAYPVTLRDEPSFQAWLDEPVPGKARIVHRGDGFELQTNMGKLQGGDPRGPTVPLRGGHLDLKTLQRGLERVHGRFKDAPDLCFVPSYGMELNQTIRGMAANALDAETSIFGHWCLVYPRPKADAGR